jgi:hypothetical protein
MPRSREQLLSNLVVGDFFRALAANGAELICLVTRVREDVIEARRFTTREEFRFDRITGRVYADFESVIDSVAPLPENVRNVLLGLDRRYRLSSNDDYGVFTEDERKALLFISSFYPENPV